MDNPNPAMSVGNAPAPSSLPRQTESAAEESGNNTITSLSDQKGEAAEETQSLSSRLSVAVLDAGSTDGETPLAIKNLTIEGGAETLLALFKQGQDPSLPFDATLTETASFVGDDVASTGLVSRMEKGAALKGPAALPMPIVESEIVEQVTQKLSLLRLQPNGQDGITLELEPKELGALQIEIRVRDGAVSADILTQHQVVKEILEKNQSLLFDALAHMGLELDQFSVNVGDFHRSTSDESQQNAFDFTNRHHDSASAGPVLAMVGESIRGRFIGENGVSIYI